MSPDIDGILEPLVPLAPKIPYLHLEYLGDPNNPFRLPDLPRVLKPHSQIGRSRSRVHAVEHALYEIFRNSPAAALPLCFVGAVIGFFAGYIDAHSNRGGEKEIERGIAGAAIGAVVALVAFFWIIPALLPTPTPVLTHPLPT
jgi:hypothetical protein